MNTKEIIDSYFPKGKTITDQEEIRRLVGLVADNIERGLRAEHSAKLFNLANDIGRSKTKS